MATTPAPDEAWSHALDALVDLETESALRGLVATSPKVLHVEGGKGAIPHFPAGSIYVAVGHKGSKSLAELSTAAAKGGQGLGELLDRLRKAPTELHRPAHPLKVGDVDVLAELHYGSKLLTRGLALPLGLEVYLAALPYGGGKLDDSLFRLHNYVKSDSTAPLEAIVLVHPPELSPLEKEILAKVPSEDSEALVGSGTVALPATLLVTALVTAAIYYWAPGVARRLRDEIVRRRNAATEFNREIGAASRISDETLRRLGNLQPTQAASELVRLRTILLLEAENPDRRPT